MKFSSRCPTTLCTSLRSPPICSWWMRPAADIIWLKMVREFHGNCWNLMGITRNSIGFDGIFLGTWLNWMVTKDLVKLSWPHMTNGRSVQLFSGWRMIVFCHISSWWNLWNRLKYTEPKTERGRFLENWFLMSTLENSESDESAANCRWGQLGNFICCTLAALRWVSTGKFDEA